MSEENYTATLKAGGGYADPWLVIRAETAEQLQDRLEAVADGAISTAVGRAAAALGTGVLLGKGLGAEKVEESGAKASAKEPAKKASTRKTSTTKKAPAKREEAPAEEAPAPEPEKKAPSKPKTAGRPKPAWKSK